MKESEKQTAIKMSALNGKIILSTCSVDKAQKITSSFQSKGARVCNFPMIDIHEASNNFEQIKDTFNKIDSYNWIVFTSTNGVQFFFHWLK